MPRRVAIIIPTLNEETTIGQTVASAIGTGAGEIVVSDGGSRDRTVAIARQAGARVIEGAPMRSRQLNAAARASQADFLIFLHGDTTLPPDAVPVVTQALENGFVFGGFQIRFAEDERRLRVAAKMINLRTRLTGCPWGDQAQFIARERFCQQGGFREIPIMEDYDLALRMKDAGRTVVLPQKVVTSGRRFLSKGVLATAATNWRIIIAYRLGKDPAELERMYRR